MDFLFGQVGKILEERRQRRNADPEGKTEESDIDVTSQRLDYSGPVIIKGIQTRDDALNYELVREVWDNGEAEIKHLVRLLDIYTSQYYSAKEKSAMWGPTLVPHVIEIELRKAEESVATTTEQLELSLKDVYSKSARLQYVEDLDGSDDDNELGILDFQLEGIEAMNQVGILATDFTTSLSDLTARMNSHTENLKNLPSDNRIKKTQVISIQTANDMEEFTKKAVDYKSLTEQQIDILIRSVSGMLEWISLQPKIDRSDLENFRQSMSGLREATGAAVEGTATFQAGVRSIRKLRINKAINRSSSRLIASLSDVNGTLELLETFCTNTEDTIDVILESA